MQLSNEESRRAVALQAAATVIAETALADFEPDKTLSAGDVDGIGNAVILLARKLEKFVING